MISWQIFFAKSENHPPVAPLSIPMYTSAQIPMISPSLLELIFIPRSVIGTPSVIRLSSLRKSSSAHLHLHMCSVINRDITLRKWYDSATLPKSSWGFTL